MAKQLTIAGIKNTSNPNAYTCSSCGSNVNTSYATSTRAHQCMICLAEIRAYSIIEELNGFLDMALLGNIEANYGSKKVSREIWKKHLLANQSLREINVKHLA